MRLQQSQQQSQQARENNSLCAEIWFYEWKWGISWEFCVTFCVADNARAMIFIGILLRNSGCNLWKCIRYCRNFQLLWAQFTARKFDEAQKWNKFCDVMWWRVQNEQINKWEYISVPSFISNRKQCAYENHHMDFCTTPHCTSEYEISNTIVDSDADHHRKPFHTLYVIRPEM